jgi:hypothetical protein
MVDEPKDANHLSSMPPNYVHIEDRVYEDVLPDRPGVSMAK